jgi:tetratricopeptide (TPR) repeat protein
MLVGNNLARQTEINGEPRIVLLETIREFGLVGLEASHEVGDVAARHVAWVEGLTSASAEALRAGPAFEKINLEYPNIQAALRWAIERGEAPAALRICSYVWRFWQRKGLIDEGRWWTEQALALEGARERTSERAGALATLGSLAYWGGDQASTAAAYEESLDIYREVGDELGIATATYNLSFARVFGGEFDAARSMIQDSLRRFEALGNQFWLAEVSVSLGYIEFMAGNLDEGDRLIRSAIPALADDPVREADLWTTIAQIERKRENFEEARKAVREGLDLLARDWDATLVVGLGEMRGMVEIGAGNTAWGLRLYAGASAMRDRIGGGPPLMMMMGDEVVAEARAALGDAEADRIMADGRTLTDEEVFTLAGSQETELGSS